MFTGVSGEDSGCSAFDVAFFCLDNDPISLGAILETIQHGSFRYEATYYGGPLFRLSSQLNGLNLGIMVTVYNNLYLFFVTSDLRFSFTLGLNFTFHKKSLFNSLMAYFPKMNGITIGLFTQVCSKYTLSTAENLAV